MGCVSGCLGIALLESFWHRPAPRPHPSPLPSNGRGDLSIVRCRPVSFRREVLGVGLR